MVCAVETHSRVELRRAARAARGGGRQHAGEVSVAIRKTARDTWRVRRWQSHAMVWHSWFNPIGGGGVSPVRLIVRARGIGVAGRGRAHARGLAAWRERERESRRSEAQRFSSRAGARSDTLVCVVVAERRSSLRLGWWRVCRGSEEEAPAPAEVRPIDRSSQLGRSIHAVERVITPRGGGSSSSFASWCSHAAERGARAQNHSQSRGRITRHEDVICPYLREWMCHHRTRSRQRGLRRVRVAGAHLVHRLARRRSCERGARQP